MKEKVKRILDLVRAGKLSLDDAAPLLAALNTRLALQGSDRELIDSLLGREDMDTEQIAEHLLLLRGVKEAPPVPPPPRAPQWSSPWSPPWSSQGPAGTQAQSQGSWGSWGNAEDSSWASREARAAARAERAGARAGRRGGIEGMVERITDTVERAVETAMEGVDRSMNGNPEQPYSSQYGSQPAGTPRKNRILKIQVETSEGDEYNANLPVSLAPHLHKMIPPRGIAALEAAGFSLESLQLLIESDPPSGDLINAEDSAGNEVHISIK